MYKNTLFDVLPEHLQVDWFHSYLTGQSQSVTVKNGVSHSVPHFKACSSRTNVILLVFFPLEEVINSHNLDYGHMIYADETQLDMQPGED